MFLTWLFSSFFSALHFSINISISFSSEAFVVLSLYGIWLLFFSSFLLLLLLLVCFVFWCSCSVQAVDLIPQGMLWFQCSFSFFYRTGIFEAFLMERTLFPVLHCELLQSMPARLISHASFKRVGRLGSFCQPWGLNCWMSLIKLFHISVYWSITCVWIKMFPCKVVHHHQTARIT